MAQESISLAADVMTSPLKTISASATAREAAERMREGDISALFVPGSEAGIVTTTDVLDIVAAGKDPDGTHVEDVMTAPVERVTAGVELNEAAAMMTTYGIKHLPVIDDHGDYVGMISSTDVTTELA